MTNSLARHFRMLARYNNFANQRLYDACAELSDTEREKDRSAYFGSIHGTLNHIMIGDRIWIARFAERRFHPPTSMGFSTKTLMNYAR